MFTVHFQGTESLYSQLYQAIVDEIRSGRMQPLEKMPSRRALAQHLGVSLNTVKRTYDQLTEEGYLVARERSGYYVDKLNVEALPKAGGVETLGKKAIPDKGESVKQTLLEKPIRYDLQFASSDRSKLPESVLQNCSREAVREILKRQDRDRDFGQSTSHGPGLPQLRVAIAEYLRERRGVSCDPSDIIITTGYRENLSIVMRLFPDLVFAAEDPGYLMNRRLFLQHRHGLLPIPLDKYGLSVADLENTPADIVVVTPNHQFPTGIIMGIRRSQRLLNWASDRPGRYIVEDSYDSEFKYSGHPVPALKSLDTEDKVILSGSFSQSLCHFLRIGYLVLPSPLMREYIRQGQASFGASLLEQRILARFMQTGNFDKHVNRMTTYYRKKRNSIIEVCKGVPGVEILGADAGQHMVLRFSGLANNPQSREAVEKNWQKAGIRIEKVDTYRSRPQEDADYILGYGSLMPAKLAEAVAVLLDIALQAEEITLG